MSSTKNTAKDFEFWHGGREYPIESVDYNIDYNEVDTTDSSTDPNGTESVPGRSKRTSKVNAYLYGADGSEVTTGTLTAGTKYRVTGGTITEGSISYPVGTIFTSAGTGSASSTNKVVPLGSVITSKNMSCTVAGVSVPVTSFNYNTAFNETDTTDSSTAAEYTDFVAGRGKRGSSIEMIQRKEDADLLTSSPAAQAVVLTLASGITITGNATFMKLSETASSKADAVKVKYDLTWNGVPTLVIPNTLSLATSAACKIVMAKGTTTDKAYSGNALVISMDISADVSKGDPIKLSYSLNWVGAVTPSVVA